MQAAVLVRYGAYPVVFGGAAIVILFWISALMPPWPIYAVVTLTGLLAVALLERVQPFAPEWNRDHNDTKADATHLIVNLLMFAGTGWMLQFDIGRSVLAAAWPHHWLPAFQVLLAGAIFDVGLYAMHRSSHRVPWLWRLHMIHHSAERLYFVNGERRHPVSAVILAAPGLIVLTLIGAPADIVSAWLALLAIHLAFQHANIDYSLGPLRGWIAGAEMHRWHHRRDYVDAQVNFGEFWLIWDRMLGTYFHCPQKIGASEVGLQGAPLPTTYIGQIVSPWRSAGLGRLDATDR